MPLVPRNGIFARDCSDGTATEQEEEAEHRDESDGLEGRDEAPQEVVHDREAEEAGPPRRDVRREHPRPPHHR